MAVTVWNKLYRAELLKDVRFRTGRIFEGLLFMYDLSPTVKKYPGDIVIIPHHLYYYRMRQGSICHSEEPSNIGSLRSLMDIATESKEKNPAFAHKMEMRCHQTIIYLNGQIELNKEWKRKYASTYRPLLKQISLLEIAKYQVSIKYKIALFVIRLCPAIYPVLLKIKRMT
jgi:hypothetical protein